MASDVTCPGCGAVLKLPAAFAGRAARCPKCRATVPVPSAEVLELDDEPAESFAFTPGTHGRPAVRPAGWSSGAKIGVAAAVLVVLGVGLYFALAPSGGEKEKVEAPGPAAGKPAPFDPKTPPVNVRPTVPGDWGTTVFPFPASAALGPGKQPAGARENTLYGLAHDAIARLPDGPAAATAAHVSGFNLAVGYADGSTAVWDLEKPITDAPRPGPKFAGRVENIWLGAHDRYVVAEVGGGLSVASIAKPHLGVRVPRVEMTGVRVCAFGTVAVVQKTAAGYQARWLVHGITFNETPMPPKQFGDQYFSHLKGIDPPPAAPRFLVWLHDVPAAVLPDGRISTWSSQGKVTTAAGKVNPVKAWKTGPQNVIATSIDDAGTLQIRRSPDFSIEKRIDTGKSWVLKAVSNDSGLWTLAADESGGAMLWEVQGAAADSPWKRSMGTADEPVLPFAAVGDVFVVGRGRAVELWSVPQLKEEMKKPQ